MGAIGHAAGLLENVRRVASRIARRREERDAAVAWADRMLAVAEDEARQLIHVLAEFADAEVTLTAPFVEEFSLGFRSRGRLSRSYRPGSSIGLRRRE